MNIYKLTNKNVGKYLVEFNKTYYGKLTFLVSYGTPFILLLWGLILIPHYLHDAVVFVTLICAMIISLLIGTKHFYNELKGFLEENKK